jgi:Rieske Fe-S protein
MSLVLPSACSSGSSGSSDGGHGDASRGDASPHDASRPEVGPRDAPPEATLVDGSGTCKQDDWTLPISISAAGISAKGTWTETSDPRFADLAFQEDRILVINPLNGTGYVAMSGVCTHMGCCPQYLARACIREVFGAARNIDTDGGVCPGAPTDGGTDGSDDAPGAARSDAAAKDAGDTDAHQAGSGSGTGGITTVEMTDVLLCPCHGSLYDAITGAAIYGPAKESGPLQVLETCVGNGYVFVTIPQNPGGPGAPLNCQM